MSRAGRFAGRHMFVSAPRNYCRRRVHTEYAILVGVLVVIAIIAIVAFKGKVQDLWNAISEGINSL